MVKIGGYDFEGPWGINTTFNDVPGIYVVYTSQYWLDVGETGAFGSRLNGNNHERRSDWDRRANGYPINIAFFRVSNTLHRLQIEAQLRLSLQPLCGDR